MCFGQTERFSQISGHRANAHAEHAALDRTTGLQLADHIHRQINRNGKRNALKPTADRCDHRIDGDHLATHVKQRPPGVTGIDRSIMLNEGNKVTRAVATTTGARLGAHDAAGERALKAERLADCGDPLADTQAIRITQFHSR